MPFMLAPLSRHTLVGGVYACSTMYPISPPPRHYLMNHNKERKLDDPC